MATNYISKDLFGGNMRVDIPEGFTDISTVRQVPDHQEVFASNTTQTSIIIEITERVERSDWEGHAGTPSEQRIQVDGFMAEGEKATLYHLGDICGENRDSYEVTEPPKHDTIPRISDAPTWTCQALVTTNPRSTLSADQILRSMIHFFLVRLERQKADILVHINVPYAELERSGDPNALPREEAFALDILNRMKQTLEILDYGLFGT